RHNARWRRTSRCKLLADLTPEEVTELGSDVRIASRAHQNRDFGRYLPITRELMWFLGWDTAEGTFSKHQASLDLGQKDEPFLGELAHIIAATFGETPRCYNAPASKGFKFYVHSVMAARLLRAWGLDKQAHEKKVPDLVFSLPDEMQLAF